MNDFDKQQAAARLVDLYRERGQERTEEAVLQEAKRLAKARGWSLAQAIESTEDLLLSHNPNPEKWDSDSEA